MKIIKVPITEQNKELYHSSSKSKLNKQKWQSLLNKCQSMTAKEFWLNEWVSYSESDIPTYWFFVEGASESIVDELIRLKLGETSVYYPWICDHSPEDLIESRMDWDSLKSHADDMCYFIENLYGYIK